jgi:hypothetical protein
MTMGRITLAAAVAVLAWLSGGSPQAPLPFASVAPAHAIVGRPLTPVSVAGVARRTTRRCMAGVYYC